MTLSEKLQAAEGGSRALDAEVHAALVPDVFFSPLVLSNQYYTSSLDAALALAERVLPGVVVYSRSLRLDVSRVGWARPGVHPGTYA